MSFYDNDNYCTNDDDINGDNDITDANDDDNNRCHQLPENNHNRKNNDKLTIK